MKIIHASVYPFPVPMRAVLVMLDIKSGEPSTHDLVVVGGQLNLVQDDEDGTHEVRHQVLVWDDCDCQTVTTQSYEAAWPDTVVITGPSSLHDAFWQDRISRAVAGLRSNRKAREAREANPRKT